MPRKNNDLPPEVDALSKALLQLARREGLTRTSVTEQPAALALGAAPAARRDTAQQARAAEEAIRREVNTIINRRDRKILTAALNLDGRPEKSFEARINSVMNEEIGEGDPHYIDADTAKGYFRTTLVVELAWRLLGGAPVSAQPSPPTSDIDLAARYRRQHQDDQAQQVLARVIDTATDAELRRDAWRVLGEIAVDHGEYDDADHAFGQALALSEPTGRGGHLAMSIDRYAKKLTTEEEYQRASAIVEQGLAVFLEGRWLWRRLGVIKWYAGDLTAAYAALTIALHNGYPISRVLHARGQVLAEMGRYDDAIRELTEALEYPRSAHSVAYAKSARAYATGMKGNLASALREFAEAEAVTPNSSWLHYWRARCHLAHGQPQEAMAELGRALSPDCQPLNKPKLDHAEALRVEIDSFELPKARPDGGRMRSQ